MSEKAVFFMPFSIVSLGRIFVCNVCLSYSKIKNLKCIVTYVRKYI